MERVKIAERADWKQLALQLGFKFHTIDGGIYWDESAYYQFSLEQIENDIEEPTAELHEICLDLVDRVCRNEEWLTKLRIPPPFWEYIRDSWLSGERQLYGRMDFSYNGKGPAKFYEYNADTPTSLYESAFFQWVWLEQCIERGMLPQQADQFNSIQERLIEALSVINIPTPLYFSCCKDTEEDRGTVQYLEDCAQQAGFSTKFIHIDDIGVDAEFNFTDLDNYTIPSLFKLYPWEWLMRERFGECILRSHIRFIEPAWKSILSNKGILPLLWELHPNHPNLLPAYFEEDRSKLSVKQDWVKKPIFSREGSNIDVIKNGRVTESSVGPYDDGGFILQAYAPPPCFDGNYALIGSWVVADQAVGISIREDNSEITKDSSRFIPHIIL